jgi:hypothetical protein
MNLGYWLVEVELEQMAKYLDLVQNSLQQHLEEIEKAYQEDMAREMTEDEEAFLESNYTDDFIEAGRNFPQLLLLSFIVTWYSFVEQELIDLCQRLKLSITIGPKDEEYLDKGIRRARKFFLKAKNYEIDANHWQELVSIGKLRNRIVHEGKRLSCDYRKPDRNSVPYLGDEGVTIYIIIEEALFRYLQKHDMIEISGPPFIDIVSTFEYCKYLVEFSKEFFYKLYTGLMPNEHFFKSGRG